MDKVDLVQPASSNKACIDGLLRFGMDMSGNREVDVRHEGLVEYTHALDLMKQLQKQRIDDVIPDTLLIMEHPEVVTVGPRARNDGILPPEDYATHPVDRGGGLTWHGAGQLVAYPIFKWDFEGEVSVAAIIHLLEEWIIKALATCDIKGSRDERMQGVWVDGKKISSIGLSFLRWTSRHGFTINYNTPKGRVEMLAGCGLDSHTTTSLAELGYTLERDQLLAALLQSMNESVHRSQKKE